MILIGYSGHAFVAYGILQLAGYSVTGYCDVKEKEYNPFGLPYLGSESSANGIAKIKESGFFIGVGDNGIRKKVFERMAALQVYPVNALHPAASIGNSVVLAKNGIMISAGVCINPLAKIGMGAICNTGSLIEHECVIGDFAHIGPGTVLCGNVTVGAGSFVGAGAVVRQGINIGENAMIGAGAVVIKNVADNETVIGNPSRVFIKQSVNG